MQCNIAVMQCYATLFGQKSGDETTKQGRKKRADAEKYELYIKRGGSEAAAEKRDSHHETVVVLLLSLVFFLGSPALEQSRDSSNF
jgi:hypothetical protein